MSTFVLDTNTISFYIRDNKIVVEKLRNAEKTEQTVLLAPFAWYEVKRGLLAASQSMLRQKKRFEEICALYETGLMDNSLLPIAAIIYADLQRTGHPTAEMDIFVAAYCLKCGHILVTNNTRHFIPIPDLLLADWSV
jgi:tRNA(fMet)-specific endonuclease VapC